jgi:hypothetical protein
LDSLSSTRTNAPSIFIEPSASYSATARRWNKALHLTDAYGGCASRLSLWRKSAPEARRQVASVPIEKFNKFKSPVFIVIVKVCTEVDALLI